MKDDSLLHFYVLRCRVYRGIGVLALVWMSQLVLAHEAVTQPKPPPPHPPLQALPKIEITGRIEPEDVKRAEKTSIQKMRERLDQAGPAPTFSFREKTRNDGTRISQIRTLSGVYCLEPRNGS